MIPDLLQRHYRWHSIEDLSRSSALAIGVKVFGDNRGKFEIYKDKADEFRFRLKASNGQTILASEGYEAKAGCTNGIASVKKKRS